MLSPKFFIDTLASWGVEFYTGVPDSLLKNVCAYITDHIEPRRHIIAANEGGAVALAAGYHLATNKVGCVYMQNSGQGNTINPLASLTDREVYHIPLLLLIGWRGRPGVHDEPQHVKQGKITTGLLNTMGINYEVLSKEEDTARRQIEKAMTSIKETGDVYALVVEKDTFDTYTLQHTIPDTYPMSREEAIQTVAQAVEPEAVVVSTTGMISRELFEYRAANGQGHGKDFLTVGSMGHASHIALGIALQQPSRRIYCFDGDGAAIMHMGGLAIVGSQKPANFIHIVFNNGAHDSVGGQPTAGHLIDFPAIALACGYKAAFSVSSRNELDGLLTTLRDAACPAMVEINVRKGNRKDLGRPTTTPIENKEAFMHFLSK
jgi:phosphonopyruvate decarboxylase